MTFKNIRTKIHKLNSSGFSHHAIMALIVVAVAVFGTAYEVYTHASSPSGMITGVEKKCLDNQNNQKVNFNKIDLYSCNDGPGQTWTVNATATTAGTIVNSNGYCLDVYEEGTTPRTVVDLYQCDGTAAQEWTVTPIASRAGYDTIVNPHSNLCLDDRYGSAANGTQIQLYNCNNRAAEQWTVPAGSTTTTTPAPTVNLSATPTSVTSGSSSTLTWSTTNATSCTASGSWSGTEATSGTQSTGDLSASSTYTLSCTGSGGSSSASTTVAVTSATSGSSCGSTPCANQTATASAICGQYNSANITVGGMGWVRSTDNWGGGSVCLNQWDGQTASYLVQTQSASGSGSSVLSFPNLCAGYACNGTNPTAGWTSLEESAIPASANFSMYTNDANVAAGSKYDTGADLWFGTGPTTFKGAGNGSTLEVFIALNQTNSNICNVGKETINGVQYCVDNWTQSSWHEITFTPVTQVTSVTDLALAPFFNFCVTQGYIPSTDYFDSAGFGNEIDAGGSGLQVTGIGLNL